MRLLILLPFIVLVAACGAEIADQPTNPPDEPTATAIRAPSPTATLAALPTVAETLTATSSPTAQATNTAEPQPTSTPTGTPFDLAGLQQCVSALTIVSMWHHHRSPWDDDVDGSVYLTNGDLSRDTSTGYLRENTISILGTMGNWDFLQPYCEPFLDLSMFDQFQNGLR